MLLFHYFLSLINGLASPFFQPTRGLRWGLPLSLLLLTLIAKGLSKCLVHERCYGGLKGICLGTHISLTHLIFIGDVIFWGLVD